MKPTWIALPGAALLLGVGLLTLADGRQPVTPAIPVVCDAPEPIVFQNSSPLEMDPAEAERIRIAQTRPPKRVPPKRPDDAEIKILLHAGTPIFFELNSDGEIREQYTLLRMPSTLDALARVVDFSTGVRKDGPTYILATLEDGNAPPIGSMFDMFDHDGQYVCQCKLIRCYHNDDNVDLPIDEIGFQTIGLPASVSVERGFNLSVSGATPIKHGPWLGWYAAGTCAAEGQYKRGQRVGDWTYWHKNGSVRAIGRFKADEPIDQWRLWYEDGTRHAQWDEVEAENEFLGWQIWQQNGELHPVFDSTISAAIRHAAMDLSAKKYKQADDKLKTAQTLLNKYSESTEHKQLTKKLQQALDELALVLGSDDKEVREGQGRLLRHITIHALLHAKQGETPCLPPNAFGGRPSISDYLKQLQRVRARSRYSTKPRRARMPK